MTLNSVRLICVQDDILSGMQSILVHCIRCCTVSAELLRDPAALQGLFEQVGCTATNCLLAEAGREASRHDIGAI